MAWDATLAVAALSRLLAGGAGGRAPGVAYAIADRTRGRGAPRRAGEEFLRPARKPRAKF